MSTRRSNKKAHKCLNPTKEPLSPELLKTFKGCEHLSDDDAKEAVFALEKLAALLFDLYTTTEPK